MSLNKMAFKIIYEGREYTTDLKNFGGHLIIDDSPDVLRYKFILEGKILKRIYEGGLMSGKKLKDIEGIIYEIGNQVKLEIKKGIVYLQDKPLAEHSQRLYTEMLRKFHEFK